MDLARYRTFVFLEGGPKTEGNIPDKRVHDRLRHMITVRLTSTACGSPARIHSCVRTMDVCAVPYRNMPHDEGTVAAFQIAGAEMSTYAVLPTRMWCRP